MKMSKLGSSMWNRGKLKYREELFRFYLDFSAPLKLHEVSLGSFQVANITLCTIHKDSHNLNHHRHPYFYVFMDNINGVFWFLNLDTCVIKKSIVTFKTIHLLYKKQLFINVKLINLPCFYTFISVDYREFLSLIISLLLSLFIE